MDRPVGTVKGMSTSKLEGSARERLLAAASELFYAEGVHTVGIDRVIERAGVAKASLYSTFGSKEELVSAYLDARAATRRERITARIAKHSDPKQKLLAVFDLLAETSADPKFRGCAFVNASAEGPGGPERVRRPASEYRSWVRDLMIELAREYGAADPEKLGRQLVLLYDGAMIGASMDGDPHRAAEAREIAEQLIDSAKKKRRR
jgi:AcrR family transcriptional regulator